MGLKVVWEGQEAIRRMLTVSCARCQADPDEWCQTRTGHRASGLHALRYYEAVRAGLLPVFYQDGEALPV